jgi:hypothetical protein
MAVRLSLSALRQSKALFFGFETDGLQILYFQLALPLKNCIAIFEKEK